MPGEQSLYTRCAEDIALLELLGQVPVPPTHKPHVDVPDLSRGHTLSLRTERHLTSELAMLSSIKNEPYHVTAVCIQETDSRLHILVAVNAETSCDSDYLKSVKKGFDGLLDILRKAYASKSR